jgi:signal transduction histidine kinase/ligand-binding sensor domain-containing protein
LCCVKRGVLILLACWPCAFALDPSLEISQYAHTTWRVREGFSKGAIFSVAQTPDGYLWLGTEFGLLRFDGVRNAAWQPPAGQRLPSNDVRNLRVARDGRLWIGTTGGLASWKDGQLTHYPELDGKAIETLLDDRGGTMWAGAWSPPVGTLCAFQSGGIQCYGEDGRFGAGVTSLYEDGEGNLWAGGMTGLWRWKPDPPRLYPMPDPTYRIKALIEGDGGRLLIAKNTGIIQLRDGRVEPWPLPAGLDFKPHRLLRDRNGGLWIGASVDAGLLHVHKGRTDLYNQPDGLAGDAVTSIFEDREGNVWVSTLGGLDRFRNSAVTMISREQGLSSRGAEAILATSDGSVWIGTLNGLNRWRDGQITIYRKRSAQAVRGRAKQEEERLERTRASGRGLTEERGADAIATVREITGKGLPDNEVDSLFQDERGRIWVATPHGVAFLESDRFIAISSVPDGLVYSIASGSVGNVWMSHRDGLLHLLRASVVERIPWARLGRKDVATVVLPDLVAGGLWLGFFRGGVAWFKDGQIRASYAGAEGLGEGRVNGFHMDRDGTLWAASEGGLSRIKNDRVATLSSRNGLPCDTVHWIMEDDAHSVWLYMACGLVRIDRPELDAWAADPKRPIQATVFDSSDGVRLHPFAAGYSPRVTRSSDGRLWFLPFDGVGVINPRHLPFNSLPPPVYIEQIIADRKVHWQSLSGIAPSNLRLPALSRDLQIDYTALSFVAPEKIRFRINLEGRDTDWKDAGNERRAFYTDLPPRHYRFRVMASNNSGVWNETGDSLDFSIAPAYYQTTWFRLSCVAAFLALLWALYRYRLHQLAQKFAARMEERTRIARELHDTLLQSFQGSLLVMQTARNLLSRRPEQAVQTFDDALAMAAGAIAEGRDAIQGLRCQSAVQSDLAQSLTETGRDLARSQEADGNTVIFRVAVEGARQDLDPIIQDEAYRIARELLRNAFRHAQANQIEAEIRYEDRVLRVRIRDDGKGIDPEIVKAGGRAGHWGLLGMRECAKRIGARLDFWSEAGAGTEVELSIPSSIAYRTARNGRRFPLLPKKKANP